jgi:argininosuccinate lyase
MLQKLVEDDIDFISNIVNSAELYLAGNISNEEVIDIMNGLCTIYYDYVDEEQDDDKDLLMFKGIWSQIGDIKDEIRTGESYFGKVDTSQKDLDEYIESRAAKIKKSCKILIERYTPILTALKKKYS